MNPLLRRLFLLCLLLSTVFTPSHADGCPQKRVQQIPLDQSPRLKVLVPHILSHTELVNCADPKNVTGSFIDVFESALSNSGGNWTVHYDCFNFSNPNATYDDMIKFGVIESYNAVVGDITIAAQRVAIADFSQPYLESGIVILTLAIEQGYSSAWTFFVPFTATMWCTILGAFFLTGFVLFFLEYKNHPEFQDGSLAQRVQTVFWFVGSSLMLMQRESIKNPKAHILMVSWLIFCLLLGSSYTAGLSSYLTAQKLSPKVQDINSILNGNDSIGSSKGSIVNDSIGHRKGSIVRQYLIKRLKIEERRLMPLRADKDFMEALDNGSVMAIFDEVPYVNMFLKNSLSACTKYATIGSKLTTEGFGFAFPHDPSLASSVSLGLLYLSEHGCLLRDLQSNVSFQCSPSSISTQITVKSSISLYSILGGASLIFLVIHYARKDTQCVKKEKSNPYTPSPSGLLEPSMLIIHRWKPRLKSEGNDDGWT